MLLVRHAKAESRSRWQTADIDRPLTAKGWDQANLITAGLRTWPISLVATSPYLRCQQSVSGLANDHDLELILDDRLAEGAPTAPARRWVDELLAAGGHAVLCSHGDLIPELVASLIDDGLQVDGDRGCAKGSTWIVERTGRRLIGFYASSPVDIPSRR